MPGRDQHWRRFLPHLAGLALFLALTAYYAAASLRLGGGELVYYLDDAYIHFAMARTLAEAGVYGVTSQEFTASSSSPAWVFILAGVFKITGANLHAAGALAGLAAIAAILFSASLIRRRTGSAGLACLVALVLVAATPLALLTIQGMEHALHLLLMLAGCWWLARRLADDEASPSLALGIGLLAVLPLVRLESLWLCALAVLACCWRRRWRDAAFLTLASAAPVCVYGFWSMAHGWPFLPASILAKTAFGVPLDYWTARRVLGVLFYHPALKFLYPGTGMGLGLMVLAALALLLWRWRHGLPLWRAPALFAALFAAGTWIHAVGAGFGWGYRYEAYLVGLGIVALGLLAEDWLALWRAWRQRAVGWSMIGAVAALLVAAPVAFRAWVAHRSIIDNFQLVLDRDYFPARVFARGFPGESVVVTNLGVMAWVHRGPFVDLFGLGSRDVIQSHLRGEPRTPELFERWAAAKDAKLLVVFYDEFPNLTGGAPRWIEVAQVTAPGRPQGIGATSYGLYARDAQTAQRLAAAIRAEPMPRQSTATARLVAPYDKP